jgi:hypothetical protein
MRQQHAFRKRAVEGREAVNHPMICQACRGECDHRMCECMCHVILEREADAAQEEAILAYRDYDWTDRQERKERDSGGWSRPKKERVR